VRHNGIPYNGINVVMLWSAPVTKGYASRFWLTFKQALELGGHVRKGESGELVVYADRITHTETDDRGEEQMRGIPVMKGYTVRAVRRSASAFHGEQRAPCPSSVAAHRYGRSVLCNHRRCHSSRRHARRVGSS
jgi:antirestriction protein ArdC